MFSLWSRVAAAIPRAQGCKADQNLRGPRCRAGQRGGGLRASLGLRVRRPGTHAPTAVATL